MMKYGALFSPSICSSFTPIKLHVLAQSTCYRLADVADLARLSRATWFDATLQRPNTGSGLFFLLFFSLPSPPDLTSMAPPLPLSL